MIESYWGSGALHWELNAKRHIWKRIVINSLGKSGLPPLTKRKDLIIAISFLGAIPNSGPRGIRKSEVLPRFPNCNKSLIIGGLYRLKLPP